MAIAALMVWFVLSGVGFYFCVYRNHKVYRFRARTIDLCYEWTKRHDYKESALEWFYREGPSHEQMTFSTKPITLETWYPKDKLEKLFT